MRGRRTLMFLRKSLVAAVAVCLPLVCLAADPELKLPAFDHLQQIATDSVNVSLGPWPLGLAAWALNAESPQNADLREILRDVKSINVRSFEFDADNMYSESDIDDVRHQLSSPGWNALAQIRQRRSGKEDVDVFVSMDRDKVNGVAIIASGPRRFTIVNIVGSIDPAKLAKLEDRFGLPSLAM